MGFSPRARTTVCTSTAIYGIAKTAKYPTTLGFVKFHFDKCTSTPWIRQVQRCTKYLYNYRRRAFAKYHYFRYTAELDPFRKCMLQSSGYVSE